METHRRPVLAGGVGSVGTSGHHFTSKRYKFFIPRLLVGVGQPNELDWTRALHMFQVISLAKHG